MGIRRLFLPRRLGLILLFATSWVAAQGPLWESGKVIAVEQVSTPAKTPDASCRAVPKGGTYPAQCRPAYLRAEQFWRVTVEVSNKRFIVRPYRAPKFLDSLSDAPPAYVDPNLTANAPVQVAIVSNKSVRFRTDQGQGTLALIESQELLSSAAIAKVEAAPKSEVEPAPALRPTAIALRTSSFKVVLLENGDFVELETQAFKSQDIGDGAALYSFTGESSPSRIASNMPIFLVLAENDGTANGNVELSRLQAGKGTRQLAYTVTKSRSASSIPIDVSQVSSTVRKLNVKEPLRPGEYVVLLHSSNRGFLFRVP